MELRERVVEILNNNVGQTISGEELAGLTGVTRNSIWKVINKLKKEGYDIKSNVSSGYILNKKIDVFSSQSINNYLKAPLKILVYDMEESSNSIAKALAIKGESEGTVVIVKSQTKGRGRLGRSFISNSENGLYMTIILRPKIPAVESLNITVLGAVAVAEAIEKTSGARTQIKWVNDIYIGNKKVSGILTEAGLNFESGMLDYAVIGIGINISPPDNGFDTEISNIATSIFENKAPCGYKSRLAAEIINTFFDYYNQISEKAYMGTYRQKSNIIGKEVEVEVGGNITQGTAVDIDENGNLIVNTENGTKAFYSGEARIKRW